jgi:hypothetical protein
MPHRCGHEACGCDTEGKDYCSTHCAQAASFNEEKTHCECHHTGCHAASEPAGVTPLR